MERRQDEEQGEGIRGDDDQADHGEREQRRGVAREVLLGCCRPSRPEPLARDEPAEQEQDGEPGERESRPLVGRT